MRESSASPVGTWRVLQSSSRFLPVGALLQVEREGAVIVHWQEVEPPARLVLAPAGEVGSDRLRREFRSPDQKTRHLLQAVVDPEPLPAGDERGRRRLFGCLQSAAADRENSATGTFVAEEEDVGGGG